MPIRWVCRFRGERKPSAAPAASRHRRLFFETSEPQHQHITKVPRFLRDARTTSSISPTSHPLSAGFALGKDAPEAEALNSLRSADDSNDGRAQRVAIRAPGSCRRTPGTTSTHSLPQHCVTGMRAATRIACLHLVFLFRIAPTNPPRKGKAHPCPILLSLSA